jgi:hypothetical protein
MEPSPPGASAAHPARYQPEHDAVTLQELQSPMENTVGRCLMATGDCLPPGGTAAATTVGSYPRHLRHPRHEREEPGIPIDPSL